MPKIRLLIVDDSVVMRRLISEAVAEDTQIEVAGTASNGKIALQRITQVNPDVVTLDLEMPEMDGLATLRELRRDYPKLPVIMFSAFTRKGASATLDALAAGANDYVTKPVESSDLKESIRCLRSDLLPRIHALVSVPRVVEAVRPPSRPAVAESPRQVVSWALAGASVDLVCIASSTGGPVALEKLFLGFQRPIPVPVAIVQHMPPMFTQMLAERLNGLKGTLRCEEARHGMKLTPGKACLAMGGKHLVLTRDISGALEARLTEAPPENSCRPAADVLFRSASSLGLSVLAVVLTGMGSDGMRGCQYLREAGARVIAQDEASSVVWGMPGAVVQARLADVVLPLEDIAGEIMRRLHNGGTRGA